MPDDKKDQPKLSKTDQESFDFVKQRIERLQALRKEEQFGVNIEKIWAAADRDYAPHRLNNKRKRSEYDEDKGWRGQLYAPGTSDWQSDVSQANPFIKIQIALSILVDQNPTGIFTATSKKYQATSALIKQLYDRSWDYAKSKQQLALFVFNLAKYGWAVGRTYPLRVARKVKNLVEYNPEDPENSIYEEKEVVEYNDIYRENLDPWNVWIDDMARPSNLRSVKDWVWRKVYTMETFKEEFGAWKNSKFVQPGGVVTDKLDEKKQTKKFAVQEDLVEVYFYESLQKDLFMVIANKVPVVIAPLPISDAKGNKKLSLWQTYWNLRHAESPFGVGIYEAIRYDQGIMDRLRNMTVDQLTLSIYKMFFYQGTSQITETGDITVAPGVGKQTLDPKNINFMEVPGPGKEAWEGLAYFKNDLDEASGITDPLLGIVTGKTAFEIAQAKESALKRLKNPLTNIKDALDAEGYITVPLIQTLYSIPEVYEIADPQLIEAYLKEVGGDPELFARTDEGGFQAKVYPEFPLNLDEDEQGNLTETDETGFFRVKPSKLQWEGIINIKSQSVLAPSKQLEKAQDLEMYQTLIPLFGMPPELVSKAATEICKLYDKDPKDILPDLWLMQAQQMAQQAQANEPLIVPIDEAGQQMASAQPGAMMPVPNAAPVEAMPPQSEAGQVAELLG